MVCKFPCIMIIVDIHQGKFIEVVVSHIISRLYPNKEWPWKVQSLNKMNDIGLFVLIPCRNVSGRK